MAPQSPSKPSAGSGTGSPHNLFFAARLKLMALFVLLIAVIVGGFSLFLYQSTVGNFADASDEDFADSSSRQHFVEAAKDRLLHTLLLSDGIIVLLSAGASYALARRILKPVEESHEAQRAFAAQASHELRTPLAIMRNDIEVLMRDPRPAVDQVRSTMTSNLEEIERMTTMVGDLLLLARSEHPVMRSTETVSLEEVVARVLEKMQPLAEQKNITLAKEGMVACSVTGEEATLSRAFINVIQNSLEHTPSGGRITVRLAQSPREATVVVTDTGSGILPEDLPHVFTRFYKGPTSAYEGTGLGLAIVQEIIEKGGGTVSIESEREKGTAVTFTLPLA